MEYKKIINLLDDRTNQPSKFKTRNLVEINDESKESMIILTLDLKRPRQGQFFMIIVMHTCLLREQFQTR